MSHSGGGDRAPSGAVGSQHDVEVDEAPPLELGDLQVVEPRDSRSAGLGQPLGRSDPLAKPDHRPVPEGRRRGVPEDRALVVEAVRAERRAQQGIAVLVAIACTSSSCRAGT